MIVCVKKSKLRRQMQSAKKNWQKMGGRECENEVEEVECKR